ncbi:electron transport protein SCO1/SenC [Sphingobacteriaceae bacterium]|nr:electron transport protein SCO1/SenC [Sphingobacteriaceae bacterium]
MLLLLFCFFAIIYVNYSKRDKKDKVRLLPTLGNKIVNDFDTTFHKVADFAFVNQSGDTITQKNVEGKNYVTEYFFTTCQSICPVMNKNMMTVAKVFEDDTTFKILSHTVKPEEDSIPVLKQYADMHEANAKNWWFLTGKKKELYDLARRSYLMNNEEGNGDSDDFIHSQLFALVDKERHIRGFYDGTNSEDIQKLIKDIRLLEKEQSMNK